jgi:hypothetical protein
MGSVIAKVVKTSREVIDEGPGTNSCGHGRLVTAILQCFSYLLYDRA